MLVCSFMLVRRHLRATIQNSMALSSPVLSRPSLPTRVLKDHFTTASSVLSLPYPLALHLIECEISVDCLRHELMSNSSRSRERTSGVRQRWLPGRVQIRDGPARRPQGAPQSEFSLMNSPVQMLKTCSPADSSSRVHGGGRERLVRPCGCWRRSSAARPDIDQPLRAASEYSLRRDREAARHYFARGQGVVVVGGVAAHRYAPAVLRGSNDVTNTYHIDSIEGLALLNYIAERFDHPSGPEAKMRRVEAGARRASDWLDHDDSTIPEQSDAYTLGTSLIVRVPFLWPQVPPIESFRTSQTVAGEESCAHGASPDMQAPSPSFATPIKPKLIITPVFSPPYVFGQFVTAKTLGPLPTPSHDLSAAFTSDVSTFLKLFNSLVVPLHTQALNIERLHARDLVEPNEDAVELLWEKIDEAIEYAEETTGRILSDARIERDAAGLVENSWT